MTLWLLNFDDLETFTADGPVSIMLTMLLSKRIHIALDNIRKKRLSKSGVISLTIGIQVQPWNLSLETFQY